MIDTIITGVVVGSLTALATALFAFKKFRSEGLWKQKFDTYTSLFEAMNELMEEVDQLLDAEMLRREVAPDRRAALEESARKARHQVRKISRIGSFILSDESQEILVGLLKELEKASNAHSYFEHLDESYGALKRAIDALKMEARKDLELGVKL